MWNTLNICLVLKKMPQPDRHGLLLFWSPWILWNGERTLLHGACNDNKSALFRDSMSLGLHYTVRGAFKQVRRLTQLATRYARHILSLFNMVSCNWNALGPAFLQSSDSVIEELLLLVLQPAICRAIRTRMVNRVGDGVAQSRNFGRQPVLELTCDQVRCPDSRWLLFVS